VNVRRDGFFFATFLVLTAIGQASVPPPAVVKIGGGRVRIQATATPLSSVLDRLSRATGMKVVYEGAPPTDRLTADIDAGSETEALSRLLEGLGLTYAFKLDAAERHVETLYVTAGSASTSRRASSSRASRRPSPVMSAPEIEPDVVDESMAFNEPAPDEPDLTDPSGGIVAGSPGYVGGAPVFEGGDPQSPSFPEPASFPSPNVPGVPFPVAPVAPGPASYPNFRS
jgi:hypothetical protein